MIVNPPSSSPRILESRTQYQPCHIRVPDLDDRLVAIQVDGNFYSLMKLVRDRPQAIEIATRLAHRGEAAVITVTAKGDAIWVLERDAILDTPITTAAATGSRSSQPLSIAPVLDSRSQYRPCHIRVPDLDHRLPAIEVEGEYYSLFKVVKNRQQAQEIAAKLGRRGDRTVITITTKGEVVWVLEPEAILDSPSP